MNLLHEWIPSQRLGFTVEVWGKPDGWVEAVGFLPGPSKPWKGPYSLPASREIFEYLDGKRTAFSHRDQHRARIERMPSPFHRAVLLRTMEIPYGKTLSYSALAESISSKAWRAVGNALSRNPVPILVPCHRVVAKHGVGGFGEQVWVKRKLLELESGKAI